MNKENINDIITISVMFVLTIGASYMAYHMSCNLNTYTNIKSELNTNYNTINNPLTYKINSTYTPSNSNKFNNPLSIAVKEYYKKKEK